MIPYSDLHVDMDPTPNWFFQSSSLQCRHASVTASLTLLLANGKIHYDDVKMGAIASQITSLTVVYSIVYSDVDQRKHQSSASLAFVRGIHRGPVNSPHKWPVTRKMFPFDDVIMEYQSSLLLTVCGGKTTMMDHQFKWLVMRKTLLCHAVMPRCWICHVQV